MRAAICYEIGKPLVIEEVRLDPPKKGEVKVKIASTAICHSDIHALRGEFPGTVLPIIAGHESSGYVEEVGEDVKSVKPGDSVVVSLLASCGQCLYCISGLPHLCEADWPLRTESRIHNLKEQNVTPLAKVGSFAEYVVVDKSQVAPIPKEMPMKQAALLGCGVITGFGAVVNRAKVRPMQSMAVIGCGGVGLNSIQAGAISGAYPIIAIDILDSKLQDAVSFGATHVLNTQKEDAAKTIKQLTSGRGVDYVFVTVGSSEAMRQALSLCSKRGETVLVGLPPPQQTLQISPWDLVFAEKTLTGSFMGTTRLSVEVPKLVKLYQAGHLKLDELISQEYPLEKINEAISAVEKGLAKRNIIVF